MSKTLGKFGFPTKSGAPASPFVGQAYYDLADNKFKFYNGTSFVAPGGGPQAISGSPFAVKDVGVSGQIRAGRSLVLADFTTNLGLNAPAGIWNLGDTSDVSGNARTLSNRGTVAFGPGITGAATEAAIFTGGDKALYIADTGANDPFRIRTGSWGCWFRTAKKGADQALISKDSTAASNRAYLLYIDNADFLHLSIITDAANAITSVTSPTAGVYNDDRWHFTVATYDGTTLRLYVDGALVASAAVVGLINPASMPLNIGARAADATTAASLPFYGRIDAAFLTADVLTLDQIRYLAAAKVAHGLAAAPSQVTLNVRRRARGPLLAATDFPTQPLRGYNLDALADFGSANLPLTNNGSVPSGPGPDGAPAGSFHFPNSTASFLSAADTGLPTGTTARSMGAWVKTSGSGGNAVIAYYGSSPQYYLYVDAAGTVRQGDGNNDTSPDTVITDGRWHFAVATYDPAAADGLVRKVYVDGKLGGSSSTAILSTVLAGASGVQIGRWASPAQYAFYGEIARVFICNYALTVSQIVGLYALGSRAMPPSPKDVGANIEAMDATNLYLLNDLESNHQVDLLVAA